MGWSLLLAKTKSEEKSLVGGKMISKLLNQSTYTILLPKMRPHLFSNESSKTLVLCSKTTFSDSSINCFCSQNKNAHQLSYSQSFSVLAQDVPWDSRDIWTTLAFYIFTLHIPLSFGWMSMASLILQQHDLDPQARAISLLAAQNLELAATFVLLKLTAKRKQKPEDSFEPNGLSKERNWLLASAVGFGFLLALVLVTTFAVDRVFEPKAVSNPAVKEILLDGNISKAACVIVYCITAPVLEETVYRGFLLRSLSSTMKWQRAVLISAAVFSAAHLSGENFVQLFVVGCVLGSSYCWTGNLSSSIAIHSLYNALTLIITVLS